MGFDYSDSLRQSPEWMVDSFSILNTLQESVFLMDDSFKLTWYNKVCNELLHHLTGENITENFDFNELLTINQHIPFRDYCQKALSGEPAEFEWYYKGPVSKWLSVSMYPFRDGSRFTGICGTMRDITERKLKDQILLRNTSVLNNIEQGVVMTDANFRIIAYNRSAHEIVKEFGTDLRIGLEALNYLPPDRQATAAKNHAAALKGISSEYEALYPNNKWFLFNFKPVNNKGGRIKQVSITFKDITERKRIQAEMRILSMVARETLNAVLIMRQTGEMVWANEGFTRLTGYTLEEVLSSRVPLFGPETNMEGVEAMRIARETGIPFKGDQVIYTKQGKKVCTRVEGQPLKDDDGKVNSMFVIITDVTEEKRIMEERLRAEIELQREITRVTLETQEKARNQLGRELHDNISQILAAVNMQVGHCLAYYEEGKPILENVQANLQEAIHELRKLSHSMVMPRFAESHLNDKLKKLLENYNNGQVVHLNTCGWTEENIPVFIKETFFRVAQEQLHNINKYAQADEIVVQLENSTHEATMSIKDNGIGFDTKKERTGIGISNIISRVELYYGTTRIISAPGKGCVLSINIPLPTGS
jgi:PAS domain S-box-containing protein